MSLPVPDPITRARADSGRALPINLAACLFDAFCWGFGTAFMSMTTIVPLFLRRLHAGNALIGLVPAMISLGGLLLGLPVARRIGRLRQAKWWLFVDAIFERIPLMAIGVIALVLGAHRPRLVLDLVVGLFAAHAIFLGLNQPAYWAVIGKAIPERQRGRLFGWAGVASGIAAIFIDPITRRFLTAGGVRTLSGYADCFLFGTTVTTIGIVLFAFMDEKPTEPRAADNCDDSHTGRFIADALAVWRSNRDLRRMAAGQCFVGIAAMAQPFFVLEYGRRVVVHPGAVGAFTAIGAVLGAFGSLGWGAWGDHRGNKEVLIAAAALGAAAPILAFPHLPSAAFYFVFAASALGAAGIQIAGYNVVMEFAGDAKQIPFYTALFNAVLAPFRTAAPIIGGLIADRWGYPDVFAIAAVSAVVGMLLTVGMTEPRSYRPPARLAGEAPV